MRISFKNRLKQNDSELLGAYKESGDLELLGELYNRYIHLVYGVCLKYLENREDSKDSVNKIFEVLIRDIPKFEIENFRTWLYVVSKNFCLMELRRRKSEKRREDEYSAQYIMESTEIMHPIDEASSEDLEKGLKECLAKLKREQQECVLMFYYEEKCYNDIADELNLDPKKVKSFIQNGKRNLKICMDQYTLGN